MAYINLNSELPGIVGLLSYSPATAKPLGEFANALLQSKDGLQPFERELIASYVSWLNKCQFCFESHSAVAAAWSSAANLNDIFQNIENSQLSLKMKSLLSIAQKVQSAGKAVQQEQIDTAKKQGASDKDIHDTVLIAAAFCMFNRYVDGLGTWAPPSGSPAYEQMGQRIKTQGYGGF